jgi:hypothetical protein
MNHDFDVYLAYELIDSRKLEQIDAYDIVNFMRQNCVCCKLEHAESIVLAYTELKHLDFPNFSRIVLPQTDDLKKDVALNRKPRTSKMPNSVLYMLLHILEKETDLQIFLQEIV